MIDIRARLSFSKPMGTEEFLKWVIGQFISHPDSLSVVGQNFSHCLHISITCHPADMPKVIGGRAKMIKALEVLAWHSGKIAGHQATLHVTEPIFDLPGRVEPTPFRQDPDWNSKKDNEMLLTLGHIGCHIGLPGIPFLQSSDSLRTNFKIVMTSNPGIAILSAVNTVIRAIGSARGRKITIHATYPGGTISVDTIRAAVAVAGEVRTVGQEVSRRPNGWGR